MVGGYVEGVVCLGEGGWEVEFDCPGEDDAHFF
jgi:hypothetical protein